MLVTKAFGDLITFTRASSKWVPNAAGVLTQVAAGVAAIAFDPLALEKLGFSIEEQRTNLFKYSQDFTNSVWNKQGFTLTANVVVAPDGTTTASLLVPTAVAGISHNLEQNGITGAGAIGVTNVQSYFVKAAGYSRVAIWWPNTGAGDSFDLSTGTRIAGAAGTIIPLGNGWFRITSPYAQPTTAGSSSRLYVLEPGTTGPAAWVGAADGVSGIYVWGAQLEVGAAATSYIPTTTAQVIRAADSATINNLAPWFNPAQGTLYVEAVAPQFLRTDGGSQFVASVDDGTASNYISLGRTGVGNTRAQARAGGVTQADLLNAGNWASASLGRFALAFDSTGSAISLNGGAAVTGPGFVASSMTRLRLGVATVDGSSTWNGHIRAIRYFPRRLTNTELQALTAKADPGFTLDFDFDAKSYYMGLA